MRRWRGSLISHPSRCRPWSGWPWAAHQSRVPADHPLRSDPVAERARRRSSTPMATPTTSRLHRHLLPALPSRPPRASSSTPSPTQGPIRRPTSRLHCSSLPMEAPPSGKGGEYRPSFTDDLLLAFFRAKMVDVRVLQALFPPLLLVLFKALFAPITNGQLASMMVARATALSCQWLMGTCSVNSVTLPDGKSLSSGVLVEKCKYLEESKCLGICINTCKLPTQAKKDGSVTADYGESTSWGDDDPSVFAVTRAGQLQGEYQICNGYGTSKATPILRSGGQRRELGTATEQRTSTSWSSWRRRGRRSELGTRGASRPESWSLQVDAAEPASRTRGACGACGWTLRSRPAGILELAGGCGGAGRPAVRAELAGGRCGAGRPDARNLRVDARTRRSRPAGRPCALDRSRGACWALDRSTGCAR